MGDERKKCIMGREGRKIVEHDNITRIEPSVESKFCIAVDFPLVLPLSSQSYFLRTMYASWLWMLHDALTFKCAIRFTSCHWMIIFLSVVALSKSLYLRTLCGTVWDFFFFWQPFHGLTIVHFHRCGRLRVLCKTYQLIMVDHWMIFIFRMVTGCKSFVHLS